MVYDPEREADEALAAYRRILTVPWEALDEHIGTVTDPGLYVCKCTNESVADHIVELHNCFVRNRDALAGRPAQPEGRTCGHRSCKGSHKCQLR